MSQTRQTESGQFTAQTLSLKQLPIVKVGCIAEREASEEITAIECHSLGQRRETGRPRFRLGVPMSAANCQECMGLIDVQLEYRIVLPACHTDRLAVCNQQNFCYCLVERCQGAPEGRAGASMVVLGPKQRCQYIALVSVTREGQIDQEREGSAPLDVQRMWAEFE